MMSMEVAKRSESEQFEFGSFDDSLPVLVLATTFSPIETKYEGGQHIGTTWKWDKHKFKPGREFRAISHQTAGYACHHHYLFASELTPKPEIFGLMKLLNNHWCDSCVGQWGVSLDSILEYRAQLRAVGLDCNESFSRFEEGIYPIDCAKESLAIVTTDDLPPDLDELIEWDSDLSKMGGSVGRWKLFVLGENCD